MNHGLFFLLSLTAAAAYRQVRPGDFEYCVIITIDGSGSHRPGSTAVQKGALQPHFKMFGQSDLVPSQCIFMSRVSMCTLSRFMLEPALGSYIIFPQCFHFCLVD